MRGVELGTERETEAALRADRCYGPKPREMSISKVVWGSKCTVQVTLRP